MEIKIYIKNNCPYCTMAKDFLKNNKLKFVEIILDNDLERSNFYKKLGNGVSTVPQIFFDGERIGGYSDLIKSEIVHNYIANHS